jgi:hypothetical protein
LSAPINRDPQKVEKTIMFKFSIFRRQVDRASNRRPRTHRSLVVEGLEGRQLLSGIQGNHIGVVADIRGNHGVGNVAPAIVGQHVGTGVIAEIVGNHIGTSVIPAIVGNHIGFQVA